MRRQHRRRRFSRRFGSGCAGLGCTRRHGRRARCGRCGAGDRPCSPKRGMKRIFLANRTRARRSRRSPMGPASRSWISADLPACYGRRRSSRQHDVARHDAASRRLTVDLAPLPENAVVCDIVYVPLETDSSSRRARGFARSPASACCCIRPCLGSSAGSAQRPSVTAELRALVEADIRAARLMFVLGLTGSIGMGKSIDGRDVSR